MFEHVLEQRAEDRWSWRAGRREWLVGTVVFGLGLLLLAYPLVAGVPSRRPVGILGVVLEASGVAFQLWALIRRHRFQIAAGSGPQERDSG